MNNHLKTMKNLHIPNHKRKVDSLKATVDTRLSKGDAREEFACHFLSADLNFS